MNKTDSTPPIAFDGQCAFALSTGKTDVKGGKHRLIIDQKTYLFSNPIAKLLFRLLPNCLEKATSNWNKSEHKL